MHGGREAIQNALEQLYSDTVNPDVRRASGTLLEQLDSTRKGDSIQSRKLPLLRELTAFDRRETLIAGLDEIPAFPKCKDDSHMLRAFFTSANLSSSDFLVEHNLPAMPLDTVSVWLGRETGNSIVHDQATNGQCDDE